MSKDVFYFSHDYYARSDMKLVAVSMKHGMEGIGVYWCLVEMLYENEGYLPLEYDRISFVLRTEKNVLESIITEFELFENNTEKFWSNSILERLEKRNDKSKKAKESVAKRWSKIKNNTNVLRPNESSNTIKESKVKESKVNNKEYPVGFENIIEKWIQYKSERKEGYKKTGLETFIKQLLNFSDNNPAKAAKIIDQSMANNWAGIFELKINGTKTITTNDTPIYKELQRR